MFRFPVLLPPAVRARAGTDLDLSFSCPFIGPADRTDDDLESEF